MSPGGLSSSSGREAGGRAGKHNRAPLCLTAALRTNLKLPPPREGAVGGQHVLLSSGWPGEGLEIRGEVEAAAGPGSCQLSVVLHPPDSPLLSSMVSYFHPSDPLQQSLPEDPPSATPPRCGLWDGSAPVLPPPALERSCALRLYLQFKALPSLCSNHGEASPDFIVYPIYSQTPYSHVNPSS